MKTKICPRCGSDDVEWVLPQNWSQWSCNNCGYTGLVVEVDEESKEEIQENWEKHKPEILRKTTEKHDEDKKDE